MKQQANAILIEVSVEKVAPAGFITSSGRQGQAATLRGRSSVSELCFSETVYVVDESLRNIRILQSHGSVVVTVSERWRYEYDAEGGWLQHVFNEAIRIVTSLPIHDDEEADVALGFDQALAKQILEVLDKIYPSALKSPMELKAELGNAPDDRTLMAALDALLCDGLILGKDMRDHTSGERRLVTLAMIQISREGRQSLRPISVAPNTAPIVHGDQFINYGYLGAAGRNSSGTVVINQSTQGEPLAALDRLLSLLQHQAPQTPEIERAEREFHKVRDEIADEEQPDQSSVTKWLTRGKQLLTTAALGHEVVEAAHTVYKLFGL